MSVIVKQGWSAAIVSFLSIVLSLTPSFATSGTSPDCTISAIPAAGPPGTTVALRGICSGIRYGRDVLVSFDGLFVSEFQGQGPDYFTVFVVPEETPGGRHEIELVAPEAHALLDFGVITHPVFCAGDCNDSGGVEVDEIVVGVSRVLETAPDSACPVLDTDGSDGVTVDELLAVVNNALVGCGHCRDSYDCPNAELCLEPGGFIGCGICHELQSECESDDGCAGRGDDYICAPARPQDCTCQPDVRLCTPGCHSSDDCGPNEECDGSSRCRPRPCAEDDCGPLFSCLSDDTGQSSCIRTPCAGDSVCEGGYCVNGRCYGALGECSLPPP